MTNIRPLPPSGDERQPAALRATRPLHPRAGLVWLVLAARLGELRRVGVIDDASFAAVARALETARDAHGDDGSVADLVASITRRAEVVLPAELSGVLSLGNANEEVAATVLRLTARQAALGMLSELDALRAALLALADEHTITSMPALLGDRPAQPTTFAHFLGGVIAPLATAAARLRQAYADLNRSPIGAGLLSADVIEVDRHAMATSLGFDMPIANTFDAVANTEDLAAFVAAGVAAVAPVRRFVDELCLWLRTDPTSLRLADAWLHQPEPGLPHLTTAGPLRALALAFRTTEGAATAFLNLVRSLGYGPTGAHVDTLLSQLDDLTARSCAALGSVARFVTDGLMVNRAWLANRAGRGFTTSGDLAAFLMMEESLPPSVAQAIAAKVITRTMATGAEVTAIGPAGIDAAALEVIGREVQVEPEALGRALAPRRFLERRNVAGSPAPERTRDWLDAERERLTADRDWREHERVRLDSVLDALMTTISDAAGQAD